MLPSFRRYQSQRVRKFLLDLFAKDFLAEERDGLDIVITALFRYKRALLLLVSCNLVAAVLEGGTLGLLGLAVSVLVGENGLRLPEITGSVGNAMKNKMKMAVCSLWVSSMCWRSLHYGRHAREQAKRWMIVQAREHSDKRK